MPRMIYLELTHALSSTVQHATQAGDGYVEYT